MLAALEPASLARMRFPLGELTKPEVRRIAADAGLPVASKVDSQDLCFLAGTNRGRFLERHGGVGDAPGRDRRSRGGRPRQRTTASTCSPSGQRRGIGVANGEPLYVLEKDADRNRVVVGTATALAARGVAAAGRAPAPRRRTRGPGEAALPLRARCRRRSTATPTCWPPSQAARRRSPTTVDGPAPGQLACLLDGDLVVGWGTIARGRSRIAPDREVQGPSNRGCRGRCSSSQACCGAGSAAAHARAPSSRIAVLSAGSWCWFGDPRAIEIPGSQQIVVGWIGPTGAVTVASYNPRLRRASRPESSVISCPDDHSSPSLFLEPDKRITVFFSGHNGAEMHYRTTDAAGRHLGMGPLACGPVGAATDRARLHLSESGVPVRAEHERRSICSAPRPGLECRLHRRGSTTGHWARVRRLIADQRPAALRQGRLPTNAGHDRSRVHERAPARDARTSVYYVELPRRRRCGRPAVGRSGRLAQRADRAAAGPGRLRRPGADDRSRRGCGTSRSARPVTR